VITSLARPASERVDLGVDLSLISFIVGRQLWWAVSARSVGSTSGSGWPGTAARVGQPKLGPIRSVMTDEQSDDQHLRYVDIGEFIPAAWHDQQVWVSSYRAYRLPKTDLGAPEPFDLVGVRGHLVWGRAPYREFREWTEPLTGGGVVVHTEVGDMQHTPEGACLMLTTPTELGSADEEARSRLQSALALLRLALGPNVAVSLLSEFIYTASTCTVTTLQTIRPPDLYPPPDSSLAGLRLIADLDEALRSQNHQDRNRIELSLQWACRASETLGVDGFLMHWFALEALAMPGSEKVSAVEKRLANIYECDQSEIRSEFRMGKLYGVRGDIVHHGHDAVIYARVLDFMAAVYWDLLLDALKLAPYRAAGAVLAAHDIDTWFPRPLRKRAR
jgi:hypothetical protein